MHIISLDGLHQLHIFIFVLTCVHVGYSIFTVFLGFWKMRAWRGWEAETRTENYDSVAGTVSNSLGLSVILHLACDDGRVSSVFCCELAALRNAFKLKRTKTYVASTGRHPLSPASILSWIVRHSPAISVVLIHYSFQSAF